MVVQSTTIARLLSDMPADQFYDSIQNREGEREDYVEICDITIGHTPLSTTVVPRLYNAGNLQVCDMPGFAETDPQKKIVIDILQKCFLTRIPDSTFLVVMDVNAIDDTKCETLMQNYHKPLMRLLGEHYKHTIPNLYFVLTKNGTRNEVFDSQTVQRKLTNTVLEIMDENELGATFLKRITKRHVLVDLQNKNGDELLEDICQMIDMDQAAQAIRGNRWRVDQLEAGENSLNILCCKYLLGISRQQQELIDGLTTTVTSVDKKKAACRSMITSMRDANDKALQDRQKLRDALAAKKEVVGSYERRREELDMKLTEAKETLQLHKRQSELFAEHFINHDFITYRCDVAEAYSKRFKQGYRVITNADLNRGAGCDQVILILSIHGADQAIKDAIGGDTMIPESLEVIEKIDGKTVLFNSKTQKNTCNASMNQANGILSISASWEKQFKVFIYSARRFKALKFFDDFKDTFDSDVRKDNQTQAQLEAAIQKAEVQQKEDLRAVTTLTGQLEKANGACRAIRMDAETKKKEFETDWKNMGDSFAEASETRDSLQKLEQIKMARRIEAVLRQNKVSNDLASPLSKIDAAFQAIDQVIRASQKSVFDFVTEHASLYDLPKEIKKNGTDS